MPRTARANPTTHQPFQQTSFIKPAGKSGMPAKAPDISAEVALLRDFIQRTYDMAEGLEDVRQMVRVLSVLGVSITRLADLLAEQYSIVKESGNAQEPFEVAIEEVLKEWKPIE